MIDICIRVQWRIVVVNRSFSFNSFKEFSFVWASLLGDDTAFAPWMQFWLWFAKPPSPVFILFSADSRFGFVVCLLVYDVLYSGVLLVLFSIFFLFPL